MSTSGSQVQAYLQLSCSLLVVGVVPPVSFSLVEPGAPPHLRWGFLPVDRLTLPWVKTDVIATAICRHQYLQRCVCVCVQCVCVLASYPSLLTPAFAACSTNAGEGLVKLSHMQWRTWGVAHSFCTAVKQLSESKKRHQDCLMSSAQSFYGPCLWSVAHSLTCCFSGNVPLLHTSRYVTARCHSVLPGLPPR